MSEPFDPAVGQPGVGPEPTTQPTSEPSPFAAAPADMPGSAGWWTSDTPTQPVQIPADRAPLAGAAPAPPESAEPVSSPAGASPAGPAYLGGQLLPRQ